jgi:hypothetical protein
LRFLGIDGIEHTAVDSTLANANGDLATINSAIKAGSVVAIGGYVVDDSRQPVKVESSLNVVPA